MLHFVQCCSKRKQAKGWGTRGQLVVAWIESTVQGAMASAVFVREGACLSCVRAGAGKRERRQNLLQSFPNGGTWETHQKQRHAGNVHRQSSICKPGVIEMSMKASETHENPSKSASPVIRSEHNVAPAGRWARGKVAALILAALQSVAPITPVDVFGGSVPVAEAVLTNPNTRIPKAGDVALRRAIPALNVETKKMQVS